jgi:hypothetical protein
MLAVNTSIPAEFDVMLLLVTLTVGAPTSCKTTK